MSTTISRKPVVSGSHASILRYYKRYCQALLLLVGVFLMVRRVWLEDPWERVSHTNRMDDQQQQLMLRQLVVGEETKSADCPKQDPCPTCPPVLQEAQQQQQELPPPPPQQQNNDHKNLITLPGMAASHATFLVTVSSDGHKIVPEDYEDVSGFDFQFPKACADIKQWITKSSNQEQAITQLFRETFAQAVADAAANNAANAMMIPTRPLFLDVGSNCGFFTLMAAKAGMEVHAYDLQPTCTQHVASSATINQLQDRVQVFWAGMSDGVERAFEFSSFDSGCYGAFPARKQGPQGGPEVRVTLTSIDERYSRPTTTISRPIHMLKADTEGNEIKVMEGAMRTFQQHGIRKAIVEFTPHFWESRGFDKQSGIDALCKILGFGYTISWHLQKQELPNCDAVKTFFHGTWGPPLSRDLLFVSNKLESIRTEPQTRNAQ